MMPVSQQVQIPHLSMVGAARVRGGLYGPRLHLIINVTSSSLLGWHRENSGLVFVTTPPLLELLFPSAHHLSPQEGSVKFTSRLESQDAGFSCVSWVMPWTLQASGLSRPQAEQDWCCSR